MTRHRLSPRALATGAAVSLLLSGIAGVASAQSYRYAPPPPPVEAWGAPAWGQPYGAGNWSHVTGYSYGYSGVGQPYAPVQPYAYGGHPAYGGAYPYDWRRQDRGGRYGYSVRHDERRSGYRDRWGYNDDRPPTSRRYGDDRPYADYRPDCDCRDIYLYDR
ncbi:MAG: hypothetical protein EON91_05285 [Brevundimonas sp.]|nr:MAG: hypothetical protein EON91_05285 [Brevundimonas sp.]